MTIAITGATGQLGRLVIAALKTRSPAAQTIALARSPEKAADLGVETRAFDYSKPDAQTAALAGVDTLLLISSSEIGQRAAQHRHVIAAAKAAGVSRLVYTSLLRADSSPLSLAEEHRDTEQAIKASGLDFTILRNGWYSENYTGSVGPAVAAGAFIGSAGNGRIASAARKDYAEAAAIVLTSAGHSGRVYELAGDAAYTLTELAAEISRQTGKAIPYKNLPEADYAAALVGAGLPEFFARAIASWDVAAAQGALFDEGRALSTLLGHPTTPIAASVKQALGA
ncbi:NAD(P)H dehydrogenase (quinone) [Rhodoblastus acidophilus]|uniref:SDR family oxidoreductase n=1 Tax=Rhodoblastus acidophilus TaxID=1074 RepID=UPI002224A587|nr:SDR family oxidoreductase [Rhodoblastus acidophilus]MCW2285298.1 NAD(P)H dehydrogenase (quinone) [Rhodoblastus acidophilus]MCW2334254.1 NAD(P)H dehydrogenase (quinone) [Rhodoblastus acidophilus]